MENIIIKTIIQPMLRCRNLYFLVNKIIQLVTYEKIMSLRINIKVTNKTLEVQKISNLKEITITIKTIIAILTISY